MRIGGRHVNPRASLPTARPGSHSGVPPVTLFTVLHRRATVARPGMTPCPCLSHDPGGGVAGCGGVDGP
ncbi:hypothetical protein EEB14_61055, partial [Rhodococcus sp. WS4]